jgi:hypothetical protein
MTVRTRVLMLAVLLVVGVPIALLALRPDGRAAERPATADRAASDLAPVRAATEFLVGLDANTLLHPRLRRRHIDQWATREAVAELQRLYETEATRLGDLERGFSRPALMGYWLNQADVGRATVKLWAVSVASVGRVAPVVAWRTVAVAVVRQDGRWRIGAVNDVAGPRVDGRGPEFRRQARAFQEFHVVP